MNKTLRKYLLLIMASISVSPALATDDWANINRYDASNKEIAARPDKNDGLVVLMGNSITDNWPGAHPHFFSDNNIVGRGISGQTTYQFIVRFREDVINLHPVAVVINGGINDIAENNYAYDESRTFGNIMTMAEMAEANGIQVILTSLLPSDRLSWRPEKTDVADKVASLNTLIKAYADEKGYPYVDYYTPMVYGESRALNPAYSDDGVHPTPPGYDVMEAVLLETISRIRK